MSHPQPVTIEARRAAVAEGLVARKSYRTMAADLGVTSGTIQGDVKALRKEWARDRGKVAEVFEQALHDLDDWQGRLMSDLPTLPVERRPGAIDTLLRLSDQRVKLHGLYPKPGGESDDLPTGPIVVEMRVIPQGNSKLITDQDDDPADDDDPEDTRD